MTARWAIRYRLWFGLGGAVALIAALAAVLMASAGGAGCVELERGEWRLTGCVEDDGAASWIAVGVDGDFWIWLGERWQRQSADAAEALAYLDSVEPAAELWDEPHPFYERGDWESFPLERYYAAGYAWAFYAPTPEFLYDGVQERDHFVALAEAHQSGGAYWQPSRKAEFALDAENIFRLPAAANREKWAHDPVDWRPARPEAWQQYAVHWIQIKRKWNLSFDQQEIAALRQLIRAPP